MNKLFFPHVAEQTIYFPKFAEQSFFHKKNIAPPQESNGRPLKDLIGLSNYSITHSFHMKTVCFERQE